MNKKLTLTLEKETIARAKKYAKAKNRSLSDIVENYLKVLVENEREPPQKQLHPVVASLRGAFEMPKDLDYEKALGDRLEKKYL